MNSPEINKEKGNPEVDMKQSQDQDLQRNFVIAQDVLAELLEYLDTLPRKDVKKLCATLEQAPNVKSFLGMMKEYYEKNSSSDG